MIVNNCAEAEAGKTAPVINSSKPSGSSMVSEDQSSQIKCGLSYKWRPKFRTLFFLIQESENSPAESTTASGASTSEGAVSSQPPRVPAAATTSRDRQGGDAAAVPTTTGRVRSNSESERQRNIAERLGITVSDKVLPLVTSFHFPPCVSVQVYGSKCVIFGSADPDPEIWPNWDLHTSLVKSYLINFKREKSNLNNIF